MFSSVSTRRYEKADRHCHADHHQLVVALDGAMTLELGIHSGIVTKDRAVLVPRGVPHSFQADRGSCFLVADLSDDHLPMGLNGRETAEAFFGISPGLRHLCHYLESEMTSRGTLSRDIAHHVTALISASITPATRHSAPVERAIHLVQDDPTCWTMAALGQVTGLSPTALAKRFRAETGTSLATYQADLCLSHARTLILTTMRPLAAIAFEAGYRDQSSFGRAFRRTFGVSPGSLRRIDKATQ
ncbi:AraC family transcriptional regulator [Lacibacterium aquatile]|uniref:AraC family transcriptional regulator n=1 Tax=Lacibacterium aquatile TaxID=1168082 RepID=A0ABW5DXG6_9PROT